MDLFIEKLVAKKKTPQDYIAYGTLTVAALLLLLFVVPFVPVLKDLPLIAAAGIIYGVYYLVRSRNLEYEYAVTNGDLDIDLIIAQRKRRRVFSGNCKEFEIVAPVKSDKLNQYITNVRRKIEAVSSMDSPEAYFLVSNYKNERVMVFFEPDGRILEAFRTYIPSKIIKADI